MRPTHPPDRWPRPGRFGVVKGVTYRRDDGGDVEKYCGGPTHWSGCVPRPARGGLAAPSGTARSVVRPVSTSITSASAVPLGGPASLPGSWWASLSVNEPCIWISSASPSASAREAIADEPHRCLPGSYTHSTALGSVTPRPCPARRAIIWMSAESSGASIGLSLRVDDVDEPCPHWPQVAQSGVRSRPRASAATTALPAALITLHCQPTTGTPFQQRTLTATIVHHQTRRLPDRPLAPGR